LWPNWVKRLFLESGFSKELRAALILVEKPENFEGYVTIIRRVALNLERGHSKGHWDASSYDTGMEWETAPEVRMASTSGTYTKRVSKDVIKARKEKGLYLRYSNAGHRIRNCTYLALIRLEPHSANRSRTSKISASRVRQVNEVLGELDSSDFEDE
jgi:hypothetical protein